LQAADLLAIQDHVQDACSTLAARLFASEPRRAEKGSQYCQVLVCDLEKRSLVTVASISASASFAAVVLSSQYPVLSACSAVPISILFREHTFLQAYAFIRCGKDLAER
jgi:hypothetical protein